MFVCSECGGTAPTWEAHVCPLARGGTRGPRPVAAQTVAPEEAALAIPNGTLPIQTAAPANPQSRTLLDLLAEVDEDKLDRVLAKLQQLAALDEEGVIERMERIAALQEKIRL